MLLRAATAAIAALVFAASFLITPSVALAALPCSATANYHNGFYMNPSAHPNVKYEGVSGYLSVRATTLCTPPPGNQANFSNAYYMIAGNNTPTWGQVGYELTYNHPYRWFSQFYDQSTLDTNYSVFSINDQLNTRHTFRVLWTANCSCLKAVIDTTTWDTSNFNPLTSPAWGGMPFSPQFDGETGSPNTNMPGTQAVSTNFTAMGGQRFVDDQLEPIQCVLNLGNDNSARWGIAASACDAFDIWTK